MELLGIAILIVIGFLFLFAFVDRICRCVEQCSISKSYQKLKDYEMLIVKSTQEGEKDDI